MTPITQSPEWKALRDHYEQIERAHLRDLFADDATRGETMTLEVDGVYLDYSKNRVTGETIRLLVALAERAGLRARIDAMFAGEKINVTEDRAVLHVALRAPRGRAHRRGRQGRRSRGARGAPEDGGVRRQGALG